MKERLLNLLKVKHPKLSKPLRTKTKSKHLITTKVLPNLRERRKRSLKRTKKSKEKNMPSRQDPRL